ncbi:MAG: neocarzinostatin apoprotein domain-containing protein [Acidimicrobiales bacterium]
MPRTVYLEGTRIDCAKRNACYVLARAWSQQQLSTARAGVRFKNDRPLPPEPLLRLNTRKDLVDGQTIGAKVVEAGSAGFYELFQCPRGTTAGIIPGCRSIGRTQSNQRIQLRVSRSLLINREVFDCASRANACVVRGINFDTGAIVGKGLIFAKTDAVVGLPATKWSRLKRLTDGATIEATVSGPFESAMVQQCPKGVSDEPACVTIGQSYNGVIDGAPSDPPKPGHVVEATVQRVLWSGDQPVDCAGEPGACEVYAWSYEFGQIGKRRSLTFTDTGPVPIPKVRLKQRGLEHNEVVKIKLLNMPVDRYFSIQQCVSDGSICREVRSGHIESSSFTIDATVRRLLGSGEFVADCGAVAKACEIRVLTEPRSKLIIKRLTFNPESPVPDPSKVGVAPRTKLVNRQEVEVRVTDLHGHFLVVQCTAESTVQSNQCAVLQGTGWDMDGPDSVSAVRVRRVIRTPDGAQIDCGERKGRCVLAVVEDAVTVIGTRKLVFDPSVPPPAPASISVSPRLHLVDGQDIEVVVTGAEGDFLQLFQCTGKNPQSFDGCQSIATSPVTSDVTTVVTGVNRQLPGGVDCAKANCSVVLFDGSSGDRLASKRIKFDPDAPLQGPVTIAVSTRTGLADRQNVTVAITGLVASGELQQCALDGGGRPGSVCISLGRTPGEERHSFTEIQVRVRRIVSDRDCAAVPESCSIVFNYFKNHDPFRSQQRQKHKALTFDPSASPFPGPAITVTPSEGLADGDVVTVVGSRFIPVGSLFVGLCSEQNDVIDFADNEWFRTCSAAPGASIATDSDGSFSVELALEAELRTSDDRVVQCESQCVLLVTDGIDFLTATLSFDPAKPAAPTTVATSLAWPEDLFG